ncbi:hypothetical protein [Bradyrhizobium cytisi]|nr:hypothetical protein [Bradyrhizobium cytisi]
MIGSASRHPSLSRCPGFRGKSMRRASNRSRRRPLLSDSRPSSTSRIGLRRELTKKTVTLLHRPTGSRAILPAMSPDLEPIPLRPDRDATRRAGLAIFTRAATAHVLAAERRDSPKQNPIEVAARMWPKDTKVGLVVKAAVDPTSTSDAPALTQTLTEYVIAALAAVSAGSILLDKTLQLKFNRYETISVPSFIADAGLVGFVRERAPIPVRMLLASSLKLEPNKFATLTILSNEVCNASAGNAQKMVGDALVQSVGLALDVALFDSNPAIADERPAGLRNGVAASTASAASDPTAAMIADIKTLTRVVAAVSRTEPIVLLAEPARARTMPLDAIGLALNSSFVILPTNGIAADDLIAVAPPAIVSATGTTPQISESTESLIHMDDMPTNISTDGTPPLVAATSQSLFQTDMLGLRVRWPVTWAKRDPRAVAWLTTTAW